MSEEATVLEEVVEEPETAEPVAEEPEVEEVEATAEDTETEEDDEQEEEEVPEFDEYDFGGNKLQLPKGSVPDELRDKIESFSKGTWADYTRKSQDLSERSKSLETRERVVEKIQNLNGEALDTYSRGLALKQEIQQLSEINVNDLWQTDPDAARRVSDAISQKQAEFNGVVSRVNQIEGQINQEQAVEQTRLTTEGKADVEKRIPGFEALHAKEVMAYAVSKGLSEDQADKWALNPLFTEFAYKAMMHDRTQEKVTKATKPKPAQAQPIKPATTRRGSKPNLDLVADADKMSMNEWLKKRNQQLAKA